MTAYCAHCKKRVLVRVELRPANERTLVHCTICPRSWPIGRQP